MKRLGILLITVALIVVMGGCALPSEDLEIRDWYDLDDVRDNLGGSYILMNGLDSTKAGYQELASPTANEGKGWQPIGTDDDPFTGAFDGRGYEIRNLFIDRPNEDDIGLFSAVEQSGVIENIGVTNATVIGQDRVGGLVGGNEGTVTNSYSTGNVTGGGYVGGLVGTNVGTVSNSHSGSSVTGNEEFVGGLVGLSAEGSVTDSYSTGNVTGNMCVGGLVGANGVSGPGTVSNSYSTGNVAGNLGVGGLVGVNEGLMSKCYATGNVSGNLSVGGLAGLNGCDVSDSYATGNVTGYSDVGGLVGGNDGPVSNSYSAGSVTGDGNVGGLVGTSSDDQYVSNSFWDTETSGQATSVGGTGKNTTEMQDIDTFSGATWDIVAVADPSIRNPSYIWNIVDDVTYPFLSWQS